LNRSQRKSRSSKTRSKSKKTKGGLFDFLKRKMTLMVIWILVVINAILLSSLVQRLIATGDHTPQGSMVTMQEPLKVEVLNGCGITGLANEFAEYLRRKECNVVNVDNAEDFDYLKTIIIDRGRRESRNVKKFRELIGLDEDRVLLIRSQESESEISLIVGSDYEELKAFRSLHRF